MPNNDRQHNINAQQRRHKPPHHQRRSPDFLLAINFFVIERVFGVRGVYRRWHPVLFQRDGLNETVWRCLTVRHDEQVRNQNRVDSKLNMCATLNQSTDSIDVGVMLHLLPTTSNPEQLRAVIDRPSETGRGAHQFATRQERTTIADARAWLW